MDDKLEQYLSSDDIDMVRLGAVIMEESIPFSQWRNMLRSYQCVVNADESFSTTYDKWAFTIVGKKILIREANGFADFEWVEEKDLPVYRRIHVENTQKIHIKYINQELKQI